MRLLLDMNLSPRLAPMLEQAGFDVVHWSALGPGDTDDADIMAYAKARDFVVLTHDLDFSAILAATNGDKPSVVQIRTIDTSPALLAGTVITGLRLCADDLQKGALLTIDTNRRRLRLLPLNVLP
jgi:predicted nuclease of predicted toxin-antitoxin system